MRPSLFVGGSVKCVSENALYFVRVYAVNRLYFVLFYALNEVYFQVTLSAVVLDVSS